MKILNHKDFYPNKIDEKSHIDFDYKFIDVKTNSFFENNFFQLKSNICEDYYALSLSFLKASWLIFATIENNRGYDSFIDELSIVLLYMTRHSLELLLKSIILNQNNNNVDICSFIFQNCLHNLKDLLSHTVIKDKLWLLKYFSNIVVEDEKESLFRYAFNEKTRNKYHYIDFVNMYKISLYSYEFILRDFYNESILEDVKFNEYKMIKEKHSNKGEYFIKAKDGNHALYTWQIDDNDYYKQVEGFKNTCKILFYNLKDNDDWLFLPTMFVYRHTLEILLRDIINTTHDYTKSTLKTKYGRKVKNTMNYSHDFKHIWLYAKPILNTIIEINNLNKKILNDLETSIMYLRNIDKNGDYFRYTTNKNLINRPFKKIDIEKINPFFKEIFINLFNLRDMIEVDNDNINDFFHKNF